MILISMNKEDSGPGDFTQQMEKERGWRKRQYTYFSHLLICNFISIISEKIQAKFYIITKYKIILIKDEYD